jgi:hypothetical protein
MPVSETMRQRTCVPVRVGGKFVQFWFLVILVIVTGTVIGILVINKLVNGQGMGSLVCLFGSVVLQGWMWI